MKGENILAMRESTLRFFLSTIEHILLVINMGALIVNGLKLRFISLRSTLMTSTKTVHVQRRSLNPITKVTIVKLRGRYCLTTSVRS